MSQTHQIPTQPHFGNIKVTPLPVADFANQYELEDKSKGFILAQYMMYLDHNHDKGLHHYGSFDNRMDWYANAVDNYLKD